MGRQGIIHRDLKPENILLNSKKEGIYDLRIADFGFTVHLESPDEENQLLLNSICGTPGYIAPEVLNENPFNLKADVFSVGSILYSIFTLKNLFNGQSYQEIMDQNKLCNLKYILFDLKQCSHEARDLVSLLLSKDPAKRPSAIQALAHPWFYNEKLPLQNSVNLNQIIADRKCSLPHRQNKEQVESLINNGAGGISSLVRPFKQNQAMMQPQRVTPKPINSRILGSSIKG